MYICIYIYIYVCMHKNTVPAANFHAKTMKILCVWTRQTILYICTHTNIYIYIYIYIHTHKHTGTVYVYIYIYIYIYCIHTRYTYNTVQYLQQIFIRKHGCFSASKHARPHSIYLYIYTHTLHTHYIYIHTHRYRIHTSTVQYLQQIFIRKHGWFSTSKHTGCFPDFATGKLHV